MFSYHKYTVGMRHVSLRFRGLLIIDQEVHTAVSHANWLKGHHRSISTFAVPQLLVQKRLLSTIGTKVDIWHLEIRTICLSGSSTGFILSDTPKIK